MELFYETRHLKDIFRVSPETVRNWAREFAPFLSDAANPGDERKRRFTSDDLKVLALVADYKDRGFKFEDAHVALRVGQRGEVPKLSDADIQAAPAPSTEYLTRLRDEMAALQQERDTAREEKAFAQGQVSLLKDMLKDERETYDKRLEALHKTIARLEAQLENRD